MNKNSPIPLILKTYALVLSIFSIFRVLLFLTETNRIDLQEVDLSTIFQSFVMGLRFDIVISGYILFLPALLLLLMYILNRKSNLIHKFCFYWILIFFTISFVIASVDIPYFNHFFSRLSISAFEWLDSFGFVFSMVAQEPKYFLVFLPFCGLTYMFYRLLKRIFATDPTSKNNLSTLTKSILSLLLLSVIFIGIRGRLARKSPIRIGTAYFSNHSFLNQLGLNPTFTLMRSYIDSKSKRNRTVHFMDDQKAIDSVRKYLGITGNKYASPIARDIRPDSLNSATLTNHPNVVLIIMESMSAAKMKRHGNQDNLTPFLDSIANHSVYFENIYTAGKHTFNGVFSSIFSFPALYRQHPLKAIKSYHGMSHALQSHGYSTTYFTNHDGQFDNIEGFLRANAFDKVISQKNYPSSEVKTTLGVPDDYMFRFSISEINNLESQDKPFFVTFMTASDHGPYFVPDYFESKNTDIKDQIVEYADWSLERFISLSANEKWFDNTIFIFVADHGAPLSAPYDISLDYHHSPLIFYSPKLLPTAKNNHNMGGQIDIFPTTMGILNLPYTNNTLGIDLLKEKRPYIFINDDDKIGILSDSLFLILNEKSETKLHKYRNKDKNNYVKNYPTLLRQMKDYGEANLHIFQYLLLNEEMLGEGEGK